VCVILVTVVCDKPAVHKIRGFASHSHTNFCTLCWISILDKGKPTAFQNEGMLFIFLTSYQVLTPTIAFCCRTNEEHCQLGKSYVRNLEVVFGDDEDRDACRNLRWYG
jgi:hypothetical protein